MLSLTVLMLEWFAGSEARHIWRACSRYDSAFESELPAWSDLIVIFYNDQLETSDGAGSLCYCLVNSSFIIGE